MSVTALVAAVLALAAVVLVAVHALLLQPWSRRTWAAWRPASRRTGSSATAVDGWRAWLQQPRNRWLLAAFLVGLVVRLVWVSVAHRAPTPTSDAFEYLRTARELAGFDSPTFDGTHPSAYWAPGYPALLVPLVWLTDLFGFVSLEHAAVLVNAVAGASTVLSTAYLADRWISPGSRNIAAWLMALAPAQVYWTSTQHTESVHTALILGVLCAVTAVARRWEDGPERTRRLVALGVLVGLAVLVRTPGAVLVPLVALVVWSVDRSWLRAAKAVGWTLVGSMALLLPWTVRNGLEVGIWSPASTQNATVVCRGHHEDAIGGFEFEDPTPQILEDCYRYSVFDDEQLGLAPAWWDYGGVDESRWYQDAMGRGARYALTHPGHELELSVAKMREAWGSEWDALPGAANYTDDEWAGSATRPLHWIANAWLGGVVVLALLGLLLVPACRRAVPLWGGVLLVNVMILGGLAQPHYRHPAVPLVAALAAGALAAGWSALRARRADEGAEVRAAARTG